MLKQQLHEKISCSSNTKEIWNQSELKFPVEIPLWAWPAAPVVLVLSLPQLLLVSLHHPFPVQNLPISCLIHSSPVQTVSASTGAEKSHVRHSSSCHSSLLLPPETSLPSALPVPSELLRPAFDTCGRFSLTAISDRKSNKTLFINGRRTPIRALKSTSLQNTWAIVFVFSSSSASLAAIDVFASSSSLLKPKLIK